MTHRRTLLTAIACLAASAAALAAQTSQPATDSADDVRVADLSKSFTVSLWPDAPPGPTTRAAETVQQRVDRKLGRRDNAVRNVSRPTITAFLPPAGVAVSAAVVLVPGGGYGNEVIDREGYLPAEECVRHGVAAFVLKYRLPEGVAPADGELPVPILDAQRAIRLIRANAATWRIDPRRIGIMGFSAGGHVAGTVATHFGEATDATGDAAARESARPDFAGLIYAVSSIDVALAHAGSRKRLIGESPTDALVERFSTARRIDAQTPPLFVVHARDDKIVKFANSTEVVDAAKRAGVPCAFVPFDTGGHGFGIAVPGTEPAGWMDGFFQWLERQR